MDVKLVKFVLVGANFIGKMHRPLVSNTGPSTHIKEERLGFISIVIV